MDGNEYQKQTHRFENHYSHVRIPALVCGLTAEAGEVANELERSYRRGQHGMNRDFINRMMVELGDVMWNVSEICTALGFTLNEVMETNISKLTDRYASDGLTVTEP